MRTTQIATCAFSLLLLVASAAAESDRERVDDDKVFVGYLHGAADEIDFRLYTHLCHAFVVADAEGRIKPNHDVPDRDLAQRAHKNGVQVLLSLGGWGYDAQFAQMVLNPAAEDRYVSAVLKLIDDYDYDGIDLDWEYPDSKEEIPGYERLTSKLRLGLDEIAQRKGRPMLLTMAAGAHPKTLAWLSNEFLVEHYDWVNIMTYDYAGSWTNFAGHHAPLHTSTRAPRTGRQSIERTFRYLLEERKLSPRLLALGVPLYGRAFSVGEPYAATVGTDQPGRAVLSRQVAGLQEAGWRSVWDDETQTPWLVAPDGEQIVGYDDERSIRKKVAWADSLGLRGVFFWEIGQDRNAAGGHPLQQAAKDAWKP